MIVFKFPFNESIYTVDENVRGNAVTFYSFEGNAEITFAGKITETSLAFVDAQINEVALASERIEEESKRDYEEKLQKVISFIKENNLQKLVISRIKTVNFDSSVKINLAESFIHLTQSYPNAFVYLFIQNGLCWMGAFSELLGKYQKKTGIFETMSLAGTLPVEENWTKKEIEEQKPVTAYIKDILKKYSEKTEISETYDHFSGNIKHLRTDFKAVISEMEVGNLIDDLHPTPAVCGIPKDFCKKAIENFEKYPRSLYAGYIRVETPDDLQYFVNLRCAEFRENSALIHVGGGITAKSTPEKEWRETELKAEAILKNISLIP